MRHGQQRWRLEVSELRRAEDAVAALMDPKWAAAIVSMTGIAGIALMWIVLAIQKRMGRDMDEPIGWLGLSWTIACFAMIVSGALLMIGMRP